MTFWSLTICSDSNHRLDFTPSHESLPNVVLYRITRGLHVTFARVVTCKNGALINVSFGNKICFTNSDLPFFLSLPRFFRLCTSNVQLYFLAFNYNCFIQDAYYPVCIYLWSETRLWIIIFRKKSSILFKHLLTWMDRKHYYECHSSCGVRSVFIHLWKVDKSPRNIEWCTLALDITSILAMIL